VGSKRRMRESGPEERARRASDDGPLSGDGERGRWSSRAKAEAVLRMLRGEDLETLSRELGVTAATLSEWRDAFLRAGQAGLKSRRGDPWEEEKKELLAKIGDLTMRVEIHRQAAKLKGWPDPFAGRTSQS